MNRRVTIIQSDNAVGVDGVFCRVDCSSLPTYFHAIQWYPDKGWGEIEYDEDARGRKLPNTRFNDFAPYAYLLTMWDTARAEELRLLTEAEKQAREEAMALSLSEGA